MSQHAGLMRKSVSQTLFRPLKNVRLPPSQCHKSFTTFSIPKVNHFPALGQDPHNAVSSIRMGHADFSVRERAIESPAAITQKHLHRRAAAATVWERQRRSICELSWTPLPLRFSRCECSKIPAADRGSSDDRYFPGLGPSVQVFPCRVHEELADVLLIWGLRMVSWWPSRSLIR
ncbi:hypothetical protein PO909_010332 [Leuciscus waleckii]